MSKIEEFKYIIKAFQDKEIPKFYERAIIVPKTNRTVAVTGVRRAGKTFLFYQVITILLNINISRRSILYINFEDDRLIPLKIEHMQDLLDAYYELYPEQLHETKYFFLYEIQVIDKWESFIRRLIDTEKVQIYLSGSSSKLMSYEISSALRGRTVQVNVFPLSFKEFLLFHEIILDKDIQYSSKRYKIKQLFQEYVEFGGFPEVVLTKNFKREVLKDYVDLIVYRDIIERNNIRNGEVVRNLLKYLLTNIGNLFSVNKYLKQKHVANSVSKNTLHDYYSYILGSKIIYAVNFFAYSLKVQQVNPVKIYCIDTGLRKVVAFQFSKDLGRLVENLVFIHLLRQEKEIFYWKKNYEIDFIIKEQDGSLSAINVVYNDMIPEREISALLEAKKELNCTKLTLLTRDITKEEEGITFIPVWVWLMRD